MASSKKRLEDQKPTLRIFPARSAGPSGINDHADPNVVSFLGDTPGPLGINDHAQPYFSAYTDVSSLQPASIGVPPVISPIGAASVVPGRAIPKSAPTKDAAWPPVPTGLDQPSLSRTESIFGKFSFEAAPAKGNPDAIRITGNWEKNNIISVTIPQLKNIPPYYPTTVRFHKLAAPQLIALWARWEKEGLLRLVLTYLGSFNPRFIRNSKVLSNHAFGSAFDINADWNKQGNVGALVGEKGSVRELVPIANEMGFYWGGHFPGRSVDAQHFEVGKIL